MPNKNREIVQERLEIYQRFTDALYGNFPVYVKIPNGDYEGSIAKANILSGNPDRISIEQSRRNFDNIVTYEFSNFYQFFTLTWDGRKNKIKSDSGEVIWLDGYEGPTVFCLIDKKAAAVKLLQKPQLDIRGNIIAIGDEVLYINIRYGSGSCLCDGVVVGFKAKNATSAYASTNVIIRNDQNPDEESKISNSENMILRKKS
jgi:hypothetical protein